MFVRRVSGGIARNQELLVKEWRFSQVKAEQSLITRR
jgi:hypothetical protein